MRIQEHGEMFVEGDRLILKDWCVHCEHAGYPETADGEVDDSDLRYQRDMLCAILREIVEGNYDPGIAYSRVTADAVIERVRAAIPRSRPWWRFWK
jgi:hypothetical protein